MSGMRRSAGAFAMMAAMAAMEASREIDNSYNKLI